MDKNKLVEEVKKLIAAPSCFPDFRKVAEDYLNSVGKPDESEKLETLKKWAAECRTDIDPCIEFLKSDMGHQIYGDKTDETIAYANERKAAGEDTCICPACQASKAILEITK